RPVLATPTVAGRPPAVFGGPVEALAPPPPLPQAATLSAVSARTAALARKAISLLRVMLAPLIAEGGALPPIGGSPWNHAVNVRWVSRGCRRPRADSFCY